MPDHYFPVIVDRCSSGAVSAATFTATKHVKKYVRNVFSYRMLVSNNACLIGLYWGVRHVTLYLKCRLLITS